MKKTFDNEWIFQAFDGRPTFFTKRMFGGLAASLHERLMLVLVEPTSTGRWTWHGVLVCTDHAHHPSIRSDFPALMPHHVLRKWLYIDSTHEDFESTLEAVARCLTRNDRRFGIVPGTARPRASSVRVGTARRGASLADKRRPRSEHRPRSRR
jgi:hypothetical protein